MSLLLDALKRAEEAKRAKLSAGSETSPIATPVTRIDENMAESKGRRVSEPELRIEDYKEVIPPRVRAEKSPPVELALEMIPEEKYGTAPLPTPPAPSAALAASISRPSGSPAGKLPTAAASINAAGQPRDAARSVFVAKQSTSMSESSSRKWLPPVIAIVLVAVGAGGWYVWNEINRTARPQLNVVARPANTVPLPTAQPATGQPGLKSGDPAAPTKAGEPAEAPLPPLLPPPAVTLPPVAIVTSSMGGPPLTERQALASKLKDAPSPKDAPVSLQLSRSFDRPAPSTELTEAYAALKSLDYARAGALYARLIQADPMNVDAQLGMATVFARRGDSASAANHYRQALAVDPRNATALSGLFAVSDPRSPAREVELKTLLGRSPNSSSLQFTLGNFYASQRRWVEAQQAFFEAFRLDSGNADYVYNLAVSLDHLKQPKLALDYYQKALVLLPKSGGQFDRAAVAIRVKELAGDSAVN